MAVLVEVYLPPIATDALNFKDVFFTAIEIDVIVVTNISEKAEAESYNACSY